MDPWHSGRERSVKGDLIDIVIIAIYSSKITNYNVVGYANFMIRITDEDER